MANTEFPARITWEEASKMGWDELDSWWKLVSLHSLSSLVARLSHPDLIRSDELEAIDRAIRKPGFPLELDLDDCWGSWTRIEDLTKTLQADPKVIQFEAQLRKLGVPNDSTIIPNTIS